jgi:transposase
MNFVTTKEDRKVRAFEMWKQGERQRTIAKAVGVTRQTISKWIYNWQHPVEQTLTAKPIKKLISLGEHLEVSDTTQVQLVEAIGKIGELYSETLEIAGYIERQRKVSDSMIGMIGKSLLEIQKEVAAGARYLDYHKELRNLSSTLTEAQKVFNLASGLATNRLAVDMGMIEKTLANVPQAALDVWAREVEKEENS